MEGSGVWARLSWNRPRRFMFRELEQERPKLCSVAEEEFASALARVPLVIPALRNAG